VLPVVQDNMMVDDLLDRTPTVEYHLMHLLPLLSSQKLPHSKQMAGALSQKQRKTVVVVPAIQDSVLLHPDFLIKFCVIFLNLEDGTYGKAFSHLGTGSAVPSELTLYKII